MNDVLHFPVAEQYPSRTATVSGFASKRISGMSGCLRLGFRKTSHVIDVIKRDINTKLAGDTDYLSRHFRRNILDLLFAVANVPLRHAKKRSHLGLRHAQAITNCFQIVFHAAPIVNLCSKY